MPPGADGSRAQKPQRTAPAGAPESTPDNRRCGPAAALCAGLLIAAAAVLFQASPPGRQLESQLLDLFFLLRGPRTAPPDIVIAAIDEPSIQELGLAWPWPRRVHAALLRELADAGARLVVLDVIFAEPSTPEDDQALEDALRANGRVLLASTVDAAEDAAFSRVMLVRPLPRFERAALGTGLAMLTPDPDGTVRRFSSILAGQATLPAAALLALEPGRKSIPAGGLVDHPGPARSVRTVSYTQALDWRASLPPGFLKDKIVLVGRSLAASPELTVQADAFRTPFSRQAGANVPGVEVHAAILAQLLAGRAGAVAPGWAVAAAALALVPGAALLLRRLRPLPAALASLGGAGGALGSSYALFAAELTWFPALGLTGGILAVEGFLLLEGYARAARERRQMRAAFSRYVSPAVVDMLLARPELLEPGGEEAEATVLFSDLAGFTSFSERMAPGELMAGNPPNKRLF
ncbi:CHASE2 domain-containing protein [Fundidesulfovibrio agrisoli]|uniref:CHASE2 domain-containing protein n=1 Tax=Fundidesulfovibrio agrisoli TaxID=2922717 RepID=UPI001FAD0B2E|nr:CHASE2 domain-containing protein [Fundidesulfovibrio agrisoli]